MKKLAVLVLTLISVLAFATVSFAAATVGFTGELNLGYCLEDGLQGPTSLNGNPTDIKLLVNVKATDQISGVAYLRAKNYSLGSDQYGNLYGVYVDQAYLNFNTDFAAFKVGRFSVNVKDSVDLLNGILYTGDYKDGFGAQAQFGIAPGLTGRIYASAPFSSKATFDASNVTPVLTANDTTVGNYGAALAYTGGNFGGSLNLLSLSQANLFSFRNAWSGSGSNTKLNPFLTANVYVMPINSTKIYVHYGQSQDQNSGSSPAYVGQSNLASTIFGVSFDDANVPVYARLEYDFNKGVSNQGSFNPYGFRIGYKLGGGVYVEYDRVQQGQDKYDAGNGNVNTNYFKFKMTF